MRFHRHQVGREKRWHSVRVRHEGAWDWCAHHEEVRRHLSRRSPDLDPMRTSKPLELQPVH